jgi:hypothetical protein
MDGYDATFTGTTLRRVNNVVTITFGGLSGASPGYSSIVTGFTGTYTDLNGTWSLISSTGTQIVFQEDGSHDDIDPAVTVSAGTTGAAKINSPLTYFANVTWRDNIFPGPLLAGNYNANIVPGGLTAGLALNMCQSGTCTWSVKNNLIGTALYTGYPQNSSGAFPASNPDSSSTCTLSGGCFVSDFASVFTNWGPTGSGGIGNVTSNNYQVTSAYKGAASDGKDLGADMSKMSAVIGSVPHFTYYPLTIATTSLTACTHGTYCEQQLLTSSSASTPTANGFLRWKLAIGSTLPAGMNLSNGEGYSSCQVNGSYSKSGPTGCQGWLWGTPTTPGSYPMTFRVEDAAHQTATVTLTLTVN